MTKINSKEIKIVEVPTLPTTGTFMYGKLDELDFTVAGKNDTMKWGHSVKLKFIVTKKVQKELLGRTIEEDKTVFEYLSIDCDSEDEIAEKYNFYKEFKDKYILVPIENTKEKTTYKINDENLLIVDKKNK